MEGERNTKYFLNLEKSRAGNKIVSKIINDAGQEVSGIDKVIEEQRKYYEKLYSADKNVEFIEENHTGKFIPENSMAKK